MIWLYNGTILFVHDHVGHNLIEICFILNGPKVVILTVSQLPLLIFTTKRYNTNIWFNIKEEPKNILNITP